MRLPILRKRGPLRGRALRQLRNVAMAQSRMAAASRSSTRSPGCGSTGSIGASNRLGISSSVIPHGGRGYRMLSILRNAPHPT